MNNLFVEELRNSWKAKGFIFGEENKHIAYSLASFIIHSKISNEPLTNILFIGARGTGKTTLMGLYGEHATELKMFTSSDLPRPPIIEYEASRTKFGGILAIDEIHGLNKSNHTAEHLGSLMLKDDFKNNMSFIGATMRPELVPEFLRQRFYTIRINQYSTNTLKDIALIRYNNLTEKAAYLLASTCDGTPRDLIIEKINGLKAHASLQEIKGKINEEQVIDYYNKIGLDKYGLNTVERDYIKSLADSPGMILSLATLSHKLGLPEQEIKDVIEMQLVKKGLIVITSSGRTITDIGLEYINLLIKGELIK